LRITRYENPDIHAERIQRHRQGGTYVGEASGFYQWRDFGSREQDLEFRGLSHFSS
jgi:hypothetical protein